MTVLDNILIGCHRQLNYGPVSSLLFSKKVKKNEIEADPHLKPLVLMDKTIELCY